MSANYVPSGSRHILTCSDGEFASYLVLPERRPAPAIVVIQEILGVNADMREICNRLADDGYIAVCPDLYWRIQPGVSLTDKTPEEWNEGLRLLGLFDVDAGVRDIATTIEAMRVHPDCTGVVGALGYCLGGQLAYLTATRTDAEASVAYYGVNIDKALEESVNIRQPLLMHMAGEDEYVPREVREQIVVALHDNSHIQIHTYAGCNHAFARTQGQHYDAAAAKLANTRTRAFFRENLKPAP